MTPPSLLPLAGAVIAPVLGRVIENVSEGLSFLNVLHKQEQNGEAEEVRAAEARSLEADLTDLADQLRERFAQLGIDLSPPLRLKQDGHDRIVVDGNHPDRVLIESIFGSDDQLASLFHEVAEAATNSRQKSGPAITQEFRLVLGQSDALIDFA